MSSQSAEYSTPQRVYVENGWWDGPRDGVADVEGVPHWFASQFDDFEAEDMGSFLLWPINESELALELAQWEIFVDWYHRSEARQAEPHPGQPGTNPRWDEIESLLANRRQSPPPDARRARACIVPLEDQSRYSLSGPGYQIAWLLLE